MKPDQRRLASLFALGLIAPLTASATNGYFSHGYGTKNKGLAGSGVAFSQDAMAAATNPAGMVNVGERVDIGAAIFSPSSRGYSTTGGTATADGTPCPPPGGCPFTLGGTSTGVANQSIDSDNDFFLIPHIGLNWMLNSESSIGVSIYGNGGMNTEYKGGQASFQGPTGTSFTGAGTFGGGAAGGNGDAGVNLTQLFINTTYARKITNSASWGISAIAVYQTFNAKGLGNFAGFSSNPLSLSNKGTDTSTGFGLKLGVQAEVSSGLILAASYQSEMNMSEFDDYAGLFAEQGDFDIPSTYTVGLAWNTSPKTTLTADIQTINYGNIAAIANPISRLTDGSCVAGPTGGTGTGCLGASNGAGFGWEDITVIKLGYQWEHSTDWTWRVGISNGDQPIPKSETLFNILAPAVIETHITGGFTTQLANSELSAALMYAPNSSVTGINTFDGAQQIEIEMTQWEFELSWSMAL